MDLSQIKERGSACKTAADKMYCPQCGEELISTSPDRPWSGCGSFLYYKCGKCKIAWVNDQTGIAARPTNLTIDARLTSLLYPKYPSS